MAIARLGHAQEEAGMAKPDIREGAGRNRPWSWLSRGCVMNITE